MVKLVELVLAGVVVVSFVWIVAEVVVFAVVAVRTARHPWRDPVADDLDRVLSEIVGRSDRAPHRPPARHSHR